MANAWESAPLVTDNYEPTPKKSSNKIDSDWGAINAASISAQPKRDSERLAILQSEYASESDPSNKAALAREIKRAGGGAKEVKSTKSPSWMDAPEVVNSPATPKEKTAPKTSLFDDVVQGIGNVAAGGLRGAGSIGATIMYPYDKATDLIKGDREQSLSSLVTGQKPISRNEERRQQMDAALKTMGAEPDSFGFGAGKLAGEVAGTAGLGNLLVGGLKAAPLVAKYAPKLVFGGLADTALAAKAPGLLNAIQSAGFSTGNKLATTAGLGAKAADIGTRMAGGAITGGVSAGLVDPKDATTGAAVGAIMPPAISLAKAGGNILGSAVRPFFSKGQDVAIKNTLADFAENPEALKSMQNMGEIIPGSAPTSVMATGDAGLAGISRTMQSSNPKYAVDLANRQFAQNAARTAAIEDVAGNAGKIKIAEDSRDASTKLLRDDVLSRAGNVPSESILNSIDSLIKKPDNAGKLSQQALNEFRDRIAKNTEEGAINSKALYAIRKDINDVLGGKLQGDAGNLKYASGQLISVKGLIDDAIDKASRAITTSNSRSVAPFQGGAVSKNTSPLNQGPLATWSQYLEEYTKQSKPIEQMNILSDVMKRAQTGSVDNQGNLILSAAKLNNILKNETPDLIKNLTPDQIQLIRNLSADLNASQLASNAGKSVGSDTVQKLTTNNILNNSLGNKLGKSAPATNILGRLMQIPYAYANKQAMEKMGNALLDPNELQRIMNTKEGSALLKALSEKAGPSLYRAAPVAISQ